MALARVSLLLPPLLALLCAPCLAGRRFDATRRRREPSSRDVQPDVHVRMHQHQERPGEPMSEGASHYREQQHNAGNRRSAAGGSAYELVVARYNEPLEWLKDVSPIYEITVYDKGGNEHPLPSPPHNRSWTVIELPNVGRESHSFAWHLVNRYDTLAEYTVFSQGDPFGHNEFYLELLNSPWLLGGVQTMSRVFKRDHTPLADFESSGRHPWYRSERLSTRTMDSVWFHGAPFLPAESRPPLPTTSHANNSESMSADDGTLAIQRLYRENYQLPPGTNLIRHHCKLIGLPDWIPEDLEVGSFAYGSQLGFERSRAVQHSKQVYTRLLETSTAFDINGYVIERLWLMLFSGPNFIDM